MHFITKQKQKQAIVLSSTNDNYNFQNIRNKMVLIEIYNKIDELHKNYY